MRLLLATLFFLLFGTLLFSQPTNDECSTLIDLGTLPSCSDDVYTNIDATASDIGFGNSPSCFNGGSAQNDVWFSFNTNDTLIDITITLLGVLDGPNSSSINNPQIALYRGDCMVDGLAELECFTSPNGATSLQGEILGLTPNTTYFLRINDYSATAAPNWGDFTLCVEEFIPAINIGDVGESASCFGTLYDSGGPDGDYGNNENHVFTICPDNFHECITIDLVEYNIDQFFGFFGDQLNIYAGVNTLAPLITSISGASNGSDFPIQASSDCVTIEFISDAFTTSTGFELTWECTAQSCDGSTIENPTEIPEIPYNQTNVSTCEGAATFANSPCNNAPFLNGPEYVFSYDSPGGICAAISVSNATIGTGILVLNGPPGDAETVCIAQSTGGQLASANFQDPGTYYIIVANANGCTDFDISLEEAECALSAALVDALCNPLNGCIEEGGVPSVFNFEDGFQDMDIVEDLNNGCWLGTGVEPDFYWFTIEAQADGPFGFILESADNPSDIDFNVWGPFTQEEVCESPANVITFIENNQPIRSSWAAGAEPTGLADIHPQFGYEVEDELDCGSLATPGAGGDDVVSTIAATEGEVYVVLVNDWGDQIGDGGISVDWSPSQPDVLAPIEPAVLGGDTTICEGETAQILIGSGVNSIQWLNDTSSLSCTNCFDPIASPDETTIYLAAVDAVCYTDTIAVRVGVYTVDAGPDVTACIGEEFQIEAGSNFEDASYTWTAPTGVMLSCTDCPDPLIITEAAGTYEIAVTLITPNCTLDDVMSLEVLPQLAPEYSVSDDVQLCIGESVAIGGDPTSGVLYTWTSVPAGFSSNEANPTVSPTETTTYYLSVANGLCPFPSLDSVLVEVAQVPVITIASDTMDLCQGQPLVLAAMDVEDNVTYLWTGPDDIEDPNIANATAFPQSSGTYTLTATRGTCEVTASLDVTVIEINAELTQEDTTICRGSSIELNALVAPDGAVATWTPNDGSLNQTTGNTVMAMPEDSTTYFVQVEVPGCIEIDTVTILVDSLPYNLAILPSDTMICQGELVVLTTPTYEPSDFPDIELLWDPTIGAQSPDSLLNFVVTPDTTVTYQRIATSGVCVDTSFATVNVVPIVNLFIEPLDTVLCEGESVQLMVNSDEPVLDQLEELEWMPETNLSCADCLDPIASPTSDAFYSFSAEFMGCPVGASASISVINLPAVMMNTDPTVCPGSTVQLNSDSDDFSTYTWTSPDDPNFSSNVPELVVAPTVTTTYILMATNDCGTIEEQITVTVVGAASLEPIEDQFLCEGDELVLTAVGSAENATVEQYTWEWPGADPVQGPAFSEVITSNTLVTLSYTYGTNNGACNTLTETFVVTVSPAPGLVLPSDPEICFGESLVLNTDPDPDNTTYSWSSPDDPNFSSTDSAPVVTPTQNTVYMVTAETPGCPIVEEEIMVIVVPEVTMSLPEDIVLCEGDPLSVVPTIDPEGMFTQIFDWSLNGNSVSSAPVYEDVAQESGNLVLEYSYGPDCGTLTDSLTLVVEQAVSIVLIEVDTMQNEDFTYAQGAFVTFSVITEDITGLSYQWTLNGEPIEGATGETYTAQVIDIGTVTYGVIVTTASGCEEGNTIDITGVAPVLDVPNAFTPDNDGDNDFFNIVNNGEIEQVIEFKIYNRWGQLVYDNEDPDNGWDGTYNDKDQPSDVYIYNISVERLDGVVFSWQGDVTLIR